MFDLQRFILIVTPVFRNDWNLFHAKKVTGLWEEELCFKQNNLNFFYFSQWHINSSQRKAARLWMMICLKCPCNLWTSWEEKWPLNHCCDFDHSSCCSPFIHCYMDFKIIYSFIWLQWVSVAARRIFDLHCSVWDLVPWPGIEPELPA